MTSDKYQCMSAGLFAATYSDHTNFVAGDPVSPPRSTRIRLRKHYVWLLSEMPRMEIPSPDGSSSGTELEPTLNADIKFIPTSVCNTFLQSFNAVGWVTERASDLSKTCCSHFSSFLAPVVSEHGAAALFFVMLCLSWCSESLDCLTLA